MDDVLLVERDELMEFDGNAAIGILRTCSVHVAHDGDTVTVIKVIVAVRARDTPFERLRQLSLCHEPNISGGCDIVVDVAE